jgi:hypothetical protein
VGDPVASNLVTLPSSTSTNPPLVNLTTLTANPQDDRYSFVENGSAEETDHILVGSELASNASISYARFGADFPLVDLNDNTTALHASSHDGVIAYLGIPYIPQFTLTSSLNPSVYGQNVTFTATLSGASGVPTGTVSFYDGTNTLCQAVQLNGNSAACSTATLSIGSHTIKAVYSGSSTYQSATASLVQVVISIASALTCSPNPASYGATVTCTDTITSSGPTPAGPVVFKDGSTALGTVSLVGNTATFSTSTLSVGAHPIVAVFAGSSNSPPSISNTVIEIIVPVFSLSITPGSRTVYTGVSASYTVSVIAGTEGGFTLNVALSCSNPLSAGSCTITPATLGAGGIAQLVVQTSAPMKASTSDRLTPRKALTVAAALLVFFLPRRLRRTRGRAMFYLLLIAAVLGGLGACGGSGTLVGGTTPGVYTVSVTGSALNSPAPVTETTTATLNVQSLF